ncbi:MAG: hypothetical protein ABH834_07765 [Candidatus Altiarchaeota archaeon]
MAGLDDKIKKVLDVHDKVKKHADQKKISEDDYLKKKDALSAKIDPLLDEKIKRLEKEKETLVYELHGLEEYYEEKKIKEEDYKVRHVKNQERLAEIDGELAALKGGKKDLGTLYAPEKPKVVVTRSHIVVVVGACFFLIVFFMTAILGVNLKDPIVNFVKDPFRKPDAGELLSGVKGAAAGILGGRENVIGFGLIRPLSGTDISGDTIKIDFMKPHLKLRVASAKAYNAETEEECKGGVLVNGLNVTDYGVGIPVDQDRFIMEFSGCPSMKSVKTDLNRIGVEVVFESSLGDSSTQHVVTGEIDRF